MSAASEREKTTLATFQDYYDFAIQGPVNLKQVCLEVSNEKMRVYLLNAVVLHFFNKESASAALHTAPPRSIEIVDIKNFADDIKNRYCQNFSIWIESVSQAPEIVGVAWNLIPDDPKTSPGKPVRTKKKALERGISTGVDLATKLVFLADFF